MLKALQGKSFEEYQFANKNSVTLYLNNSNAAVQVAVKYRIE